MEEGLQMSAPGPSGDVRQQAGQQPPAAVGARAKAWSKRVFLGDWHPILRDPLDLVRISFVVGAVAFAFAGDGHLFIGETDTITDLADGFLSAALGGLILAGWAVGRYTTRRVPRALPE
jgi:hypothetical protein